MQEKNDDEKKSLPSLATELHRKENEESLENRNKKHAIWSLQDSGVKKMLFYYSQLKK